MGVYIYIYIYIIHMIDVCDANNVVVSCLYYVYAVYDWLDLLGIRFIAEDETLIPANRGHGWPGANLTKDSDFEH